MPTTPEDLPLSSPHVYRDCAECRPLRMYLFRDRLRLEDGVRTGAAGPRHSSIAAQQEGVCDGWEREHVYMLTRHIVYCYICGVGFHSRDGERSGPCVGFQDDAVYGGYLICVVCEGREYLRAEGYTDSESQIRRCSRCAIIIGTRHAHCIVGRERSNRYCPDCYRVLINEDARRRTGPHVDPSVPAPPGSVAIKLRHGGHDYAVSTGVASHSHRPTPRYMHTGAKDKAMARYFGVEIEAEDARSGGANITNDAHAVVHDSDGFLYVKHDGSIRCGFETVSHPATLRWWRGHDFNAYTKLAAKGYRSYYTSTCGMHVHVSRQSLSPLTILKLLTFMRENQRFVLGISRRVPSRLSQWAAPDCDSTKALLRKAKDHGLAGNRYVALNVTNSKTVEFRIFRGTLHDEAIMRNIEMVAALIQFAEGSGLRDMTDGAFFDWLQSKRGASVVSPPVAYQLAEWSSRLVATDARRRLDGRILAGLDRRALVIDSQRVPEHHTVLEGEEGGT